MKKTKKIMMYVIPVLLVMVVMFTANTIFASSPVSPELPDSVTGGTASGTVTKTAGSIWSTVIILFQILAIAAIIIAGIRYMFASADSKADIKKQLVPLVIGAVLVFGATTIIQVIVNVTEDVAGQEQQQQQVQVLDPVEQMEK